MGSYQRLLLDDKHSGFLFCGKRYWSHTALCNTDDRSCYHYGIGAFPVGKRFFSHPNYKLSRNRHMWDFDNRYEKVVL